MLRQQALSRKKALDERKAVTTSDPIFAGKILREGGWISQICVQTANIVFQRRHISLQNNYEKDPTCHFTMVEITIYAGPTGSHDVYSTSNSESSVENLFFMFATVTGSAADDTPESRISGCGPGSPWRLRGSSFPKQIVSVTYEVNKAHVACFLHPKRGYRLS